MSKRLIIAVSIAAFVLFGAFAFAKKKPNLDTKAGKITLSRCCGTNPELDR